MEEIKRDQEKLISEIQAWLREEKIKNARHDREMISRFLKGCKFETDKAKKKMKNFYEMRSTAPELFHGRDPLFKNLETLFDLGAFFPLPEKDPEGGTLVLVKATVNDPREIPMSDVFKVGVMSVDLLLEMDDSMAEFGVGVVVDMTGVGLHHAVQMSPGLIWKMVKLWQECYPVRIKSMDFVNCPPSINVVLNIFRSFLSENIKTRLRTHGSQTNSLHAVHDPKLLPEEYGGDLGPSSAIIRHWKRQILTHRDWFLNDDTII